MVVGIIDHATGTRDIRRLAGLGRRNKPLLLIGLGGAASMAALPPFLGFVAKEADFTTLAHSASLGAAAPYVLAGVVCGSVFTTIYSLRFIYGAFADKGRSTPSQRVAEMHAPAMPFLIAPAILALAGLMFGVWPTGLDHVLDDYADTMPGGAGYHLALWHGVNLPLLLSILVLAAGTAAFLGRARLRRRPVGIRAVGQRRPHLRRRHPRRRRVRAGGSPRSPSAGPSRRRSRRSSRRWCSFRWRCFCSVPATVLSCDCGTRRCRSWSA